MFNIQMPRVLEGLDADLLYQELILKSVFLLTLYLDFPLKEKSKPMRWKWTGGSTSLLDWIKNDTDC